VIVSAGTTSTTFSATAGRVSKTQDAALTATALHSVLLNWSASISPNLMNYNVYRGTTTGGPYGVATTLGLVTSYVDSNVQVGQTYYYVTTVVDDTGAESGYSNEASAVVPNPVSQSATVRLCQGVSRTKPSPFGSRSPVCGASSPVPAPNSFMEHPSMF
jgi:fibronectin type 3 domain-containing protein